MPRQNSPPHATTKYSKRSKCQPRYVWLEAPNRLETEKARQL